MAKENRSLLARLFNAPQMVPVAQILGRVVASVINLFPVRKTVDQTVPDYAWWDKFRHSLIPGYEIAGGAAKTINEILATWVLGNGVDARLAPVADKRMEVKTKHTNDVLARWMKGNQAFFQQSYDDVLGLGDIFIGVNPDDGSLRSIPPNTVELITDPLDPLKVTGIKVTTVTDKATIIETFTETERIRQIAEYNGKEPNPLANLVGSVNSYGAVNIPVNTISNMRTERFANLIGKIPIVHFAQGKGMNELHGHPFVRDLRHVLSEYDDLMSKSMQGAKVSGNPIPVFENLENPRETIELNATEEEDEYDDKDGNTVTHKVINWEEVGAFFLGKGGKFAMASPPVGFSTDTIAMLKFFREHIRDSAHTPGYVYGGDSTINPNMTEQTPAWAKFIDRMRDMLCGKAYDDVLKVEACGGLYELIHIYLLTRKLTDPKIIVAPVNILWQEITEDDEKVNFEKIKWIHSRGGITTERALLLLDLIESSEIAEEVALAKAELKEMMAVMQPTDDFGGTGNEEKNPSLKKDNTPDTRSGNGADAPRMPAYGGGGKTK